MRGDRARREDLVAPYRFGRTLEEMQRDWKEEDEFRERRSRKVEKGSAMAKLGILLLLLLQGLGFIVEKALHGCGCV